MMKETFKQYSERAIEEFRFTEQFDKEHFIEVLEALHVDQTGLANSLVKIKELVEGYSWITEGRGPYPYDDDRYREEIGHCLDEISKEVNAALTKTSKAHQICCNKYGHVHRLPIIPTQRRFRMGQLYTEFTENLMDLSLIEGET